MRYTSIETEKLKLKFSKISIGTAPFGTDISQATAFELLDYYVSCGGNLIDTAHVYGMWGPEGKSVSEEVIGKWIKARNNRDDIVIMTKGAHPPLSDMKVSRINRDGIRSDVQESLECLGIDCIDIYFLHKDDVNASVEEVIDVMDEIYKEGKIKVFGVSNWSAEKILAANEYAKKNSKIEIKISQIQWSYAKREDQNKWDPTGISMNDKEYACYEKLNIPIVAYSCQSYGFMQKVVAGGVENLSPKAKSFLNDTNVEKAKIIGKMSSDMNVSVTSLGIGYITSNKLDGIALIGSSSIEQLKDNLKDADLKLDAETLKAMEI